MLEIKDFSKNTTIISFFLIGLSSFLVRIFLIDFNLPVTLDALEYFSYANEIKIQGGLPINYALDNNGWPIFLSGFFKIFDGYDGIFYMNFQKVLTSVISTLTIIPVYFLARKFLSKKISIICIGFFTFEPRLIINSTLGISEPIYLFVMVMILTLFLTNNQKLITLSFGLTGLITIIRAEGIFLFIVLSIVFFYKFQKDKKIFYYLIGLAIFTIILLPYFDYQTNIHGNDRVISRVIINFEDTLYGEKIIEGLFTYFKMLGWNLIPFFIVILPFGLKEILKRNSFEKFFGMIFFITMSVPALYAYTCGANDTRFLYFIFPIIAIISGIKFEKIILRYKNEKIWFPVIFFLLIITSISFIEYKTDDIFDKESFIISNEIIERIGKVNNYYPESKYLSSAKALDIFPESIANFERPYITSTGSEYHTLEEFIINEKENGLTHLVVDNSSHRELFFKDVFNNEEKFPYLEKIYDSSDNGLFYHLKLFKINYELFLKNN